MDTGLKQACVDLVRAIDSDELVTTTHSALCVQSLFHTPCVIACPACWARQSAIVGMSVETIKWDRCGVRVDVPAREAADHMKQGQVEAFDLTWLNSTSQRVHAPGHTVSRKDALDVEEMRRLANELSGAPREWSR